MRTLFALLLLAASPAFAAQDDQAPSKEPVAVGAPAPATAGYMTFPMRSGKDKTGGGCLWQLPVTRKDGLEVYAAMSAVRMGPSIESALQIAGSLEKDGKKEATSFSAARLTAGPSFDTDAIALSHENGPTARVTLGAAQAMALVTAVSDHGGKLYFTHDGRKHEVDLPKPTGDDTAHIWFCLTELQGAKTPDKPAE